MKTGIENSLTIVIAAAAIGVAVAVAAQRLDTSSFSFFLHVQFLLLPSIQHGLKTVTIPNALCLVIPTCIPLSVWMPEHSEHDWIPMTPIASPRGTR